MLVTLSEFQLIVRLHFFLELTTVPLGQAHAGRYAHFTNQLLIAFRVLESYVVGISVFDFGDAPRHLTSRAMRQMETDSDAFASVASEEAVAKLNEDAYMTGFEVMLDGFGIYDY